MSYKRLYHLGRKALESNPLLNHRVKCGGGDGEEFERPYNLQARVGPWRGKASSSGLAKSIWQVGPQWRSLVKPNEIKNRGNCLFLMWVIIIYLIYLH